MQAALPTATEQSSKDSSGLSILVSPIAISSTQPLQQYNGSRGLLKKENRLSEKATATNILLSTANNLGSKSNAPAIDWKNMLLKHLSKLKPCDRTNLLPVDDAVYLDEAALEAIFQPLEEKYNSGVFQRMLKNVSPALSHAQSFGKAFDVACGGGGPLAAGLIWGGIRLVMEISTRASKLHENISIMLGRLSSYLQLFERWTSIFPPADFPQLSHCMKNTCLEFVSFIVEAIIYLRRGSLANTVRLAFFPRFEEQFRKSDGNIKRHIDDMKLQLHTSGFESAKQNTHDVHSLLKAALSTRKAEVALPFRYLQNNVHNDQFYGREDILSSLEQYICAQYVSRVRTGISSVVLHGLGGCGKSSIAREYLFRHLTNFEVIIWLYADSKAKLDLQFIDLARAMNFFNDGSTIHCREVVLQFIQRLDVPWLIVFDNADDQSFLPPYWPTSNHGSIVITSRNPTSREEGFARYDLKVKQFEGTQGADLLLKLIDNPMPLSVEDQAAAVSLSQRFDGLPLPIKQAASFIKSRKCSPAHFRSLYELKSTDIDGFKVHGYDKTVSNVWAMSLDMLPSRSLELLYILTLLDPDKIPLSMFIPSDMTQEASFLQDPLSVLDAVAGLSQQSFVDHDLHEGNLQIHRLLQDNTFRSLATNENHLTKAIRCTIGLLNHFFKDDAMAVRDPETWKSAEKILPHVQSLHTRCASKIPVDSLNAMLHCLSKLLNYCYQSGQYNHGEEVLQKARKLADETADPDHKTLAKLSFLHSRICQEQNKVAEAVNAIEKCKLSLDTAAKTEPALLQSGFYLRVLSNLGISYTGAERFTEAEDIHQQAIDRCVEYGLEEECSLGNIMQNLGSCLLWKGDLERAEDILRKALLMPNRNSEGNLYTLGNLLLKTRRPDEALKLHKEVLDVYLADLGSFHPCTADSYHKVGSILADNSECQDLVEGERCLREALFIYQHTGNMEQSHGPTMCARTKWKLADVLRARSPAGCADAEESRLRGEALEFLQCTVQSQLRVEDVDNSTFDNLVFYWAR